MSDNEDLLGDDLGDHSLADYNLGNEEEEQLLADDFDGGTTHSVPSGGAYIDSANPLTPIESPQIVPSEMAPASNAECGRERFISERPVGAQRTPQGNFAPRQSFPTPHIVRPNLPPMRPDIPELQPEIPQQMPPQSQGRPLSEIRPDFQNYRPPFRPNVDERPNFRPNMDERQNFRPNMDVRPNFNQNFERPNFRPYNNRPFGPTREIVPNNNIPQVIIRQPMLPHMPGKVIEPDVRMLPLQLPPALPGGITGKKVLINPHFKGNFQPPVEGPIKDIDSAAERFIAEQRNALARAAQRNARRSPQR
ncbi:unnamed protein product [Leptidea sinapis]|uniref:Uncharacterized protein n=1 Tax=Leptidea sinapis TaxID=189913 RepID=A0A5E4Q6L4_9NEOP|nr:unnamed protein product [Leptidea sinapis]